MAKVHCVKMQLALLRHRQRRCGGADARLLTAQLHDPAQAHGHALDRHIQAQQALHRAHRHAQVGGKGNQRPQLPGALYHPVAADQEGAGPGQRGQGTGHRLGEELGDLQFQQLLQVALAKAIQAPGLALLLAGALDELHHRQGFHHERGHVRRTLAQLAHIALHLAPHPAQPEHVQGDQHQGQQRQLPGQGQEHGQRHHQADHAGHGGEQ